MLRLILLLLLRRHEIGDLRHNFGRRHGTTRLAVEEPVLVGEVSVEGGALRELCAALWARHLERVEPVRRGEVRAPPRRAAERALAQVARVSVLHCTTACPATVAILLQAPSSH
jgi:hypothetical protein